MAVAENPTSPAPEEPASADAVAPVRIKKYANRRLYNTATSSYVTLDHLATMVKEHTDFVVHDAKTGEDITRAVLTQIIVEEEGKVGQNMLPIGFLRQLISFYGDNLQSIVPRYLDTSMQLFSRNQSQMREYMQGAFGNLFPFQNQFEEMGKHNLALFQNALQQMWAPFRAGMPGIPGMPGAPPEPGAAPGAKPVGGAPEDPVLEELRKQIAAMQRRLEELSKKS
jgi:polyhydroxyalkanoate synthesis repressor PhaR